MKICISSTGKTLNSTVDPRFGRCQFFLIVDSKTKKINAIPNAGVQVGHGAGISAAQLVADKNVEAIITGNIGPNAFMVLNQSSIEIYTGAFDITCKKALEMFDQGKLIKAKTASAPGHGFGPSGFGRGHGGPPPNQRR